MTYVLVAAVVLALVYEVTMIVREANSNGTIKGLTISEIFWRVSAKRPVVPFAVGFLCGHLFAQAAQ